MRFSLALKVDFPGIPLPKYQIVAKDKCIAYKASDGATQPSGYQREGRVLHRKPRPTSPARA
jgi:hypothetical protein